jgi:hypothetical protein
LLIFVEARRRRARRSDLVGDTVCARDLFEIQGDQELFGGFDPQLFQHPLGHLSIAVFDRRERKFFPVLLDQQLADSLQLFDLGARGGVDQGFYGFFEARVTFSAVCQRERGLKGRERGSNFASISPIRASSSSQYSSRISISSTEMSCRMMFSTRIRADSSLPTSRSCAISLRATLESAVSFCWAIRSREMESFRATLSLLWDVVSFLGTAADMAALTTRVDEGAMVVNAGEDNSRWPWSCCVVLGRLLCRLVAAR